MADKIAPYLHLKTSIQPLTDKQWDAFYKKTLQLDNKQSNCILSHLKLIGGGCPSYKILLGFIYSDRFEVANHIISLGTPIDSITENGNTIWHDLLFSNQQKQIFPTSASRFYNYSGDNKIAEMKKFYTNLWLTSPHLINHINNDGVTPLFMNDSTSFSEHSIFPAESKRKLLSSIDLSITCTPLAAFTTKKYPATPCTQLEYAKRIMSSYMKNKWDIERAWLTQHITNDAHQPRTFPHAL